MSVYSIADLNIKINPIFPQTETRLAPYLVDCTDYDFDASVSMRDIELERSGEFPDFTVESTLILRNVCRVILEKHSGFFFHSSALMLDGEAYVFTAQSGTGKSTHTSLWRKHFGERVVMINDDKPIIRKVGGKFFIYGTPWMGKADIGNNVKAPIKAVYVLKRGDKNSAERVTFREVFKEIFEATVLPDNAHATNELLSLFDEFFSSTPIFRLTCNISDEAVTAAYNAARNI